MHKTNPCTRACTCPCTCARTGARTRACPTPGRAGPSTAAQAKRKSEHTEARLGGTRALPMDGRGATRADMRAGQARGRVAPSGPAWAARRFAGGDEAAALAGQGEDARVTPV